MFNKHSDYENQIRRICLMSKSIFLRLSFVLILMIFGALFLLSSPGAVFAGQSDTDQTFVKIEPGSFVVGYWDLRDRESFLQVTNVSGGPITVHVQTFNASDPDPQFQNRCTEFNFADTYTGNDTHVYNVRNLTRNDGVELFPPILDDGHGYIVVAVQAAGGGCANDPVLLANFRIIDTDGNYEYRALTLGDHGGDNSMDKPVFGFNFNNVDDTSFSDVVIMSMQRNDKDLCLGDPKQLKWAREIIDTNENIVSCDDRPELGCRTSGVEETTIPLINLGVNQGLPNSKGGSTLCSGTNPNGWMIMADKADDICDDSDKFCGGWIGLNNGDGTGSMDSWVGLPGNTGDYFD